MSTDNPVTVLVGRFGSIRKLLSAMGEGNKPNLIQHWQKIGRIPHYRRAQIVAAARSKRVRLDDALLDQLFRQEAA